MRITTLLLTIALHIAAFATNYYVAPTGNDANAGTIAAPWLTVGKVNSRSYVAGDQILFQRGGTYIGNMVMNQSGTAAAPIIIGSYGTGALPIITGAVRTSGWTSMPMTSGTVWKCSVAAEVKYVYQGGTMLTNARYPSTGFAFNDAGNTTQIKDADLPFADGALNGAGITMRNAAWSWETVKVASYAAKAMTFATPIQYNVGSEAWGYFLTNKLAFLTGPGQWVWEAGTLYIRCTGDVDPNTVEIFASTPKSETWPSAGDVGVYVAYLYAPYVTIKDLEFRYYSKTAIRTDSPNTTVQGCTIRHCFEGFGAYGSNETIRDNTISDTYESAIYSAGGDNYVIEGNTMADIAIRPGLGKNGWGYSALGVGGAGAVVRNNTINRVGYFGIGLSGNALCEGNIVTDACYILADGSGITWDHCDGLIVRGNIVLNTGMNLDGIPVTSEQIKGGGNGYYFGNTLLKNITMTGNLAAGCKGNGVWVDHVKTSSGNKITDNTFYGNRDCQIGFSDWSNNTSPANGIGDGNGIAAYNDVLTGNVAYCTAATQDALFSINSHYFPIDFGTFNSNLYCNPWKAVNIKRQNQVGTNQTLTYTLAQWQAATGEEAGSTATGGTSTDPADHILVVNDTRAAVTKTLPAGTWRSTKGVDYSGTISLPALGFAVLYKTSGSVVTPPPPTITSITATSSAGTVNEGGSAQLSATVQGTGAFATGVSWQLLSGGGIISSTTGNTITYTAGQVNTNSIAVIRATAMGDPSKFSDVSIVVKDVPVVVPPVDTSLITESLRVSVTYTARWVIVSGGGSLSTVTGTATRWTSPNITGPHTAVIRATSTTDATRITTFTLTVTRP